MLGNRRLAKRSIIGTKVCALWQDGRFYPGVIQNQPSDESFFQPRYTVQFEDGYMREVTTNEIIGPGFNNISSVTLKYGQKVYLTMNGREVSGVVTAHDRPNDEVTIVARNTNVDEVMSRKLDDVRLMESRKSARLVDMNTDYSKLADLNMNNEAKKRAVSHVIDVPSKSQRYRRQSMDDDETENVTDDNDVEMMDETIAAMVLTSLSCSPKSPKFPHSLTDVTNKSPGLSSSVSSGFHSERSDPSPPLSSNLSESAPVTSGGWFFGSFPRDDGIVLEETVEEDESLNEPKRKRLSGDNEQVQKKTMFKCTWKGCKKMCNTCESIEKHVRTAHLGLKETDTDLLDHEEEFYYTEIEVNVENVTQTFRDMFTSSPPDSFPDRGQGHIQSQGQAIPDHDYQKKEHRQNFTASSVPTNDYFNYVSSPPQESTFSASQPINMPQMKRSLSWQNNVSSQSALSISPSPRQSKPSMQERLQQHQAQSPKSHTFSPIPKQISSHHKKPRSEVRKCRKVYGMENRDAWCTQCKWKKACSRFTD